MGLKDRQQLEAENLVLLSELMEVRGMIDDLIDEDDEDDEDDEEDYEDGEDKGYESDAGAED